MSSGGQQNPLDEVDPYLYDHDADNGGSLALFAVVVAAILLQLFGDIKVFSYVFSHPWRSLLWIGAYVGCGVVYATGRWVFLLLERRLFVRGFVFRLYKKRAVRRVVH